ncbi:MAG: hypothetical protein IEMM0002_0163 [bacterium]|nr:MAG: hypothetical protein IEMM0002_0163 [bacterium]
MDYSALYSFFLKSYAKLPRFVGSGYAFRPMTLFVELTYRCNFRCGMCQFHNLLDDPRLNEEQNEELSTEEIKRVIDEIIPYGLVSFTGGEPLLRKDLFELVRHACKRHKVYLVTNGLLLKDEISRRMVELGCSGLFSRGVAAVGISVEGTNRTHDETVKAPGSFDKIMQNAETFLRFRQDARKRYPLVALKCVITQNNVEQLADLYRLAEGIGADIFNPITFYKMPDADRFEMSGKLNMDTPPKPFINFNVRALKAGLDEIFEMSQSSPVQLRLTPPGISRGDVTAIYENRLDMSNKACYSPWSSVALSAYGDVFPCSNYSVGNIRNDEFMKLWNGEPMRGFRRELKKRGIFNACKACCAIVRK